MEQIPTRPIDLVHSDMDVTDFFVPNGGFRNGSYELHSLISDSRLKGDASPYLAPASARPPSETEGKGELTVQGHVFTNLPAATIGYGNLSPMAARIFLTLSGWRSLVPQVAVEAVLFRHGSTDGDPEVSIDQLVRMSLIERSSAGDQSDFLEVPLAAALFGRRKLEVHPSRAIIESDIRFLQDIGATTVTGLKEGLRPRVESFFRRAARKIGAGSVSIDDLRPVLEFLAREYPPAWLLLADLEEEMSGRGGASRAAEYVRRYLETQPPTGESVSAWQRLVVLYRAMGDVIGGCSAFLKAADLNEPPLNEISSMANWLNNSPDAKDGVDLVDRKALFKPFAGLMETYLPEASATDLSRLAWLHLHSGDSRRALEIAEIGLRRNPENTHCQRLVAKLTEFS
jgi:hypothetical protein